MEWVLPSERPREWEKVDAMIWISSVTIQAKRQPGHYHTIALRIDGRGQSGTEPFRVDMKLAPWPWEAIDDGKGFHQLSEALAFADKWARAAQEQKSPHPEGVAP